MLTSLKTHRTTHHFNNLSDLVLNVLKGPVPESCFNNCINRIKISEIKIEIHSVSYQREGGKGVCHTAWQQDLVQSWVILLILYLSHTKGI